MKKKKSRVEVLPDVKVDAAAAGERCVSGFECRVICTGVPM